MYLIIGAPGTGKSPFAQKMIEGRRCLVFDVNNEYGSRTKYPGQVPFQLPTDIRQPRSRYVGWDIKQFTTIAMARTESVIIIEESTAFFRGNQSALTSRLIIGRKHTGNVLVFLFHSINRVPPEIMEMSDWVVLFRTNDEERTIERKYPRLLPYFLELQIAPKGDRRFIQMI